MNLRLQIILLTICLGVLIYLIHQMSQHVVDIKYTLSWLLLDGVLFFLTICPDVLNYITHLLGIESPVNMLFFLGFLFLLVVIYTQTIALSRLSNRLRKLSQKVALDEYSGCEKE